MTTLTPAYHAEAYSSDDNRLYVEGLMGFTNCAVTCGLFFYLLFMGLTLLIKSTL